MNEYIEPTGDELARLRLADPIYPQDADPWYVQQKKMRGDWETVGIVPRPRHTRSEALARYEHLSEFGKLRCVSKRQAYADYEAGRARRP